MPIQGKPTVRLALIAALLLTIAIALLFAPGLDGEFLSWDDSDWIVSNCTIQNPSIKAALGVFHPAAHHFYQPITSLSWMLDVFIGGLDPFVFHLLNLVYFIVACLLLFWLVLRLLARYSHLSDVEAVWAAFGVALLFALHPAHVESVAWATERKDLLALLFLLASFLLYERMLDRDKRAASPAYWFSLVFFVLAILSKGYVAAMAAALAAFDLFHARARHTRAWPRLLASLPFFFLGLAAALFYGSINRALATIQADFTAYGLTQRIWLVLNYIGDYCYRLFIPFDMPNTFVLDNATLSATPMAFFGLAAAAAALALVIYWYLKRRTLAGLALAVSIIYLIPGLGILPLNWSARYLLLPALLPALAFVALSIALKRRFARAKLLAFLPPVVVGLLFAAELQSRLPVWQNSAVFFLDAARQHPDAQSLKLDAAIALRSRNPELGLAILAELGESPHNQASERFRLALLDYQKDSLSPQDYSTAADSAATSLPESWRLAMRAAQAALSVDQMHLAEHHLARAVASGGQVFTRDDADGVWLDDAKRKLSEADFARAQTYLDKVDYEGSAAAERRILEIVIRAEQAHDPAGIPATLAAHDWPQSARPLLYETYVLVHSRLGNAEQARHWQERLHAAREIRAFNHCWAGVWPEKETP